VVASGNSMLMFMLAKTRFLQNEFFAHCKPIFVDFAHHMSQACRSFHNI